MNRRCTLAAAFALFLSAGVADAAPTQRELFGRWQLRGSDAGGSYTGEVYISDSPQARKVRVSSAITYSSGQQRRWSSEGWYIFGLVYCRYDLRHDAGMAGHLPGSSGSNTENVMVTLVPQDDHGLRLAGTHTGTQGFSGSETLNRDVEDLVDRYLMSDDAAQRRRLALEVGAQDDPRSGEVILRAFDVEGLALDVDAAELVAQQQPTHQVPYATALLYALESFLNDRDDAESPLALLLDPFLSNVGVDYVEPLAPAVLERVRSKVRSLMRRGRLTLMPRSERPEHGESVAEHWVFELHIDYGDHGLWAVVPRDGAQTYNYGFN